MQLAGHHIPTITVQELKAALEGETPPQVLDVRQPFELEMGRLDGSLDIPMNELPGRLAELDRTRPIAVICRTGNRSERVTQFLLAQGFPSVVNVAGGINAWAREIDPSLKPY